MKLPHRTISASGCGRCRAAGGVAYREGASLSDAAGDLDRLRSRRRHARHHRTPCRPMRCRSGSASRSSSTTGRAAGGDLACRRSHARWPTATRCCWSPLPHAINVTLYEKNTVNVTRDIVPVASINRDSFVLLVNPSFPAKTISEFIAYAKANPGKINVASTGTGNLTHLAGELFRMMTGIEMVHVPYRGDAGGAFGAHSRRRACDVSTPLARRCRIFRSGRLRALGVTPRAPAGAAGRPADRRICPGL